MSNDAKLVMESYIAGKDKFNAGGSIKDVVDFVQTEPNDDRSMSYAMGFADGFLVLVRGKLKPVAPLES